MNVEFTVNTDWERLEDVLREVTRNRFRPYGWTGAPGSADDRVLYPASELRPASHVGRRRKLYQECRYQVSWTVKDDGETEETLSLARRGVEYELLDKDADRTGVTARLLEPRLFEPFTLVLLDIAGEYDEAGATIRQQLGLTEPETDSHAAGQRGENGDGRAAMQNSGVAKDDGPACVPEPPKVRARRLGIRSISKLGRWDNIERLYVPEGLTQATMAEREGVSEETIKKDIGKMKHHSDEFPSTAEAYPKM